ncbi:ATP-grasp domain-containing protein [Longispora albida]|uniref:ATP-grasp domain-containing protein n=1 Tax=Longispora albida TaxID=203523 RepID=UPI00037DE305|nr:hypothetical protein [Longispora albida]
MTTLAVVYDEGAADPREIRAGLAGLGELVYAVPASPHATAMLPLLRELGRVVPLAEVPALRPGAVLTFSERQVVPTAELAASLGLPGHSPETARLLTSKPAQRARLAGSGVDRVRSYLLRDPADWRAAVEHTGLPAVLKPARGEGSSDTYKISSVEQAERLAGPGLVLEELLAGRDAAPYGDYVSVESVVSHGRVCHVAITGKLPLLEPFRETAQFWPAVLASGEPEQILGLTTRALAALGVTTGVTHTEIKLTAAGPRLIEVNGRLGGLINELSTRAAGISLVELAGRAALGEHVSPRPASPGRVYFQYNHPAPAGGGTLLAVRGIPQVRKVPGVTGYRRLIQPGTRFGPSVMSRFLDHLEGDAPAHADMLATIAAASAELTFVFDAPLGEVTGTELG